MPGILKENRMIYVVLYDYGPYDGGYRLCYASMDKAKAALWLADHNKDHFSLEIRELPLETYLLELKQWK